MSLPDSILDLRLRLEMTQEDLATRLGLADKVSLYRWEAGRREPSEPMQRLLRYLCELPTAEALDLLSKLESHGRKKSD